MKESPSSYRLKRNSNKSYPSSYFLKRKPCTFFCFYKYFLLVYPIKLLEFFWKLAQPIISFLINMKNLKSDFFMNIIHMQKWRVTSVYVAIPRLDQDKKPCSVTVYDGSIMYVVLVISVYTRPVNCFQDVAPIIVAELLHCIVFVFVDLLVVSAVKGTYM